MSCSGILLQLALYVLVQSYVFSVVRSRFVQIDQSPQRPTFHDVVTDLLDENKLEKLHNNSSRTKSLQDAYEVTRDDSEINSVPLRLKRNSSPCVLQIKIKWNNCLGKRYTEIHCRKRSVACYAPNNIPPKCKTNYRLIRGNKGYCPVVESCTCAAWRHSIPHTGP